MLAGGGLGAIVVAAVVEAVRRLAALAASVRDLAERGVELAQKLEKTADEASAAIAEMRQTCRGTSEHHARMSELADVVEGALAADDDLDDRRVRAPDTSRQRGQRGKGMTK